MMNEEVEASKFVGVSFYLKDNHTVYREDSSIEQITNSDRYLKPNSDLSAKYFEDDNSTIKSEFSYRDINHIIDITRKRCDRKEISVEISEEVSKFLQENRYSIEKYKQLGKYLKSPNILSISGEQERFEEFSEIVRSEVIRPFKNLQLSAAFYEYRMARAANFSVPGSGKTSMILAVFAFLNSSKAQSEYVDKLLVISPINAFNSWKEEFLKVFGDKKKLSSIDSQSSQDFNYDLDVNWKVKNLVLVNYESLPKYEQKLKELVTSETMIVFDEVHRIKNPNGKRAQSALNLVQFAKFKFVLTGTPIPNTYMDIYNFLHLLYGNEYNAFFQWSLDELKAPSIRKIEEINESLYPFFGASIKMI